MSNRFHALLAVESDVKKQADFILHESIGVFKRHEHFISEHKTYVPLEEDGLSMPDEKTELTTTVDERLKYSQKALIRLMDLILQKESTNQVAKADLVVEGKTIAKDIPATALLSLEGRLKQIREMYVAIPTLKPGVLWRAEEGGKPGVYMAPETVRFKTEKRSNCQVVVPATEHHPAQVDKSTVDVRIGEWHILTRCSMWSSAKQAEVLDRIDTLIRAVKKARQKASDQTVVVNNIGKNIFEYITG
jgi:hypothetical protein